MDWGSWPIGWPVDQHVNFHDTLFIKNEKVLTHPPSTTVTNHILTTQNNHLIKYHRDEFIFLKKILININKPVLYLRTYTSRTHIQGPLLKSPLEILDQPAYDYIFKCSACSNRVTFCYKTYLIISWYFVRIISTIVEAQSPWNWYRECDFPWTCSGCPMHILM